jgi:hypothetical protein
MSEDFWVQAKPPKQGWMGRGQANVARFNAAHVPAEPSAAEPVEPVDYLMNMSVDEYAAQRGNIPTVNDFGLVRENTSGFPDSADLRLNAQQAAELANPYRVHANTGYEERPRGIDASLVESESGHRGRGLAVNPKQGV